MCEQMKEHDQGFASQDNQGFPGGPALLAVVGIRPGEAVGTAFEGDGHEVEDMVEQRSPPFGEATSSLVFTGLVEGNVQAGVSHQGIGVGEAVEGADQGQEVGGHFGADTGDGQEQAPGLGELLLDGLLQGVEDLGLPGLQFGPAGQEELQGLGAQGVMQAQGVAGQALQFLEVVERHAVAFGQGLLKSLQGGLGDGRSGGKTGQEDAKGFGETGLAAFQFGEEEVEELADVILDAGGFLSKTFTEASQGGQALGSKGIWEEGDWQSMGGPLLTQEQEEGQGAGVEAVGFGATAGAGLGEIPHLGGGEAMEDHIRALPAQDLGPQKGGIRT